MAVADPLVPAGDGHTPLDDDDYDGLIPTYITTRGELNAAEQANVATAFGRRVPRTTDSILDHVFLRRLHTSMFGQVWTWAGEYRSREMNLGVDPSSIATAVVDLCEDARWWFAGDGSVDLAAARFHHRLVAIHPFRNGNGRHARRAADLLVMASGDRPLTWGAGLQLSTADLRRRYLAALRRADADPDDLDDLVAFARE